MIYLPHLRELIVRPALTRIGAWSPEAENLVLGTIAQESALGHYLHQLHGPALGICQMEPATHALCWAWMDAPSRLMLRNNVRHLAATSPPEAEEMIWNLQYAVAMCRVLYLSIPTPLPDVGDIPGMAFYWKMHYNTPNGRGTESDYVQNYARYVL